MSGGVRKKLLTYPLTQMFADNDSLFCYSIHNLNQVYAMDEITKDSAMALSVIDQAEAAIDAGDDGAEEMAWKLVESIMQEPNGAMFIIQGVKAMLISMQTESVQAAYDDDFELRHVWTLLNQHATSEHRELFNEFRMNLYKDSDRLRDWVRQVALVTDYEIPEVMGKLMDRVCEIPVLADCRTH